MKVAVVGSGISGLVVAHHLHRLHDLTVFESEDRLGGHTNTVEVEVPEGRFAVDTGFIVCNEPTYPNFLALLGELGVATQPSEMSFAVSVPDAGIEYRATNLSSLFAQRRNLVRPRFARMLVDVARFNRALRSLIEAPDVDPDLSLADFIAPRRYSREFLEWFLVPFGASIWSADPTTFLDFPVATYARFVANHGMIDVRRDPRWRTVTGGSATYVRALVEPFAERVRSGEVVHKISRDHRDGTVDLVTDHGTDTFDRVVVATHSDQALALLADPSPTEQSILGDLRYLPNEATLHTDESFLPANPRARASWNFHVGAGDGRRPTLTYWMNRLQSIPAATPILVTLNRHDDVDPAKVLARFEYDHPVFDAAAIRAQQRRDEIQGVGGVFYAGAYWGYGFHEDGVNSALDVVRRLAAP